MPSCRGWTTPSAVTASHSSSSRRVNSSCPTTERTVLQSHVVSREMRSTSVLNGCASESACQKSDAGNGNGSNEHGACTNGPSAPSRTPLLDEKCSVSVRMCSSASFGSEPTVSLRRFVAGSAAVAPTRISAMWGTLRQGDPLHLVLHLGRILILIPPTTTHHPAATE